MNYRFSESYQKFQLEIKSEDLIFYFSKNKYDVAFFFDGKAFIGWLSLPMFISAGCVFKRELLKHDVITDFFDYKEDHQKIVSFFEQTHVRSGLIINAGEPIGIIKQFNKYDISFDTQKKQNALRKILVYQELLKNLFSFLNYKKVGILLDQTDQRFLFDGIECCSLNSVDQYDVVLDTLLFSEVYECCCLKNVLPLDQVMACALLLELSKNTNLMKSMFFIDEPSFNYDDLYADEKKQIGLVNDIDSALQDYEYIKKVYDGYPRDLEYLNALGTDVYHPVILRYNGVYRYVKESKIRDDAKLNRFVPSAKGFQRKILFFGPCTSYSLFTSKYSTIQEFLQQHLNEKKICADVVNFGVPDGGDFLNDLIMMLYKNKQSDSYCVFINRFDDYVRKFFKLLGIKTDYLGTCFKKEHYWFFNENMHPTPKGNRLIAQTIFEQIDFSDVPKNTDISYLRVQDTDDLFYLKEYDIDAYKRYLKQNRFETKGTKGYVGMNCSPFTKGHAYLIDYARTHCDYLYVFVVEDNSNAFPFYDRFCMVQEYCKNYPNVKVLSSSVFVGSKYTISAYFNKKYDMDVDMAEDVCNFANIMIPILEIDVRFFGTEENSLVTQKINKAFEKYFIENGKKIEIVPRLEFSGEKISASFIRQCLKEGNIDACHNFLPNYVLKYLRNLKLDEVPNG